MLETMTRNLVVLFSLDALFGIGQLGLEEGWGSCEAWLPSVLLGN